MKKKLLYLLLLWTGVVLGQEAQSNKLRSSDDICIDPFGRDQYPNGLQFKKGSTVKFKISNVNPLKVKGENIVSKGENFQFEIPKEIADKVNVNAVNTKSNTKGTKDSLISLSNDAFINEYKEFLKTASDIEVKVNLNSQLESVVGDDVFVKNPRKIQEEATLIYKNAYNNESTIEQDILTLQQSYFTLKKLYNEINAKPENHTMSFTVKISGKKAEISETKPSQSSGLYDDELKAAKKAIETITEEKKKIELISKATEGKKTYLTIDSDDFTATTKAVQLNDDVVTLTPVLTGNDDKEVKRLNPITITTYGGVKVNFSTGYLLSFIGNDDYVIRYNDKGDGIGLHENKKTGVSNAIGILAHVFWDSGKKSMLGISSGISINTDAKLNFYGGASLAFLEKNRLVFTAGLSFVNVKNLIRNNLNDDDLFVDLSRTEISYSEIYKPAPFFGVTYNLSSNTSDNTKK